MEHGITLNVLWCLIFVDNPLLRHKNLKVTTWVHKETVEKKVKRLDKLKCQKQMRTAQHETTSLKDSADQFNV